MRATWSRVGKITSRREKKKKKSASKSATYVSAARLNLSECYCARNLLLECKITKTTMCVCAPSKLVKPLQC